ncbi:hypothetical protein SOVF_125000 [Spinacia oleracea]|nr:hypothetical protein SOVF_125000 [Spinacia oleracea]
MKPNFFIFFFWWCNAYLFADVGVNRPSCCCCGGASLLCSPLLLCSARRSFAAVQEPLVDVVVGCSSI